MTITWKEIAENTDAGNGDIEQYSADINMVILNSRRASPDEYADLKRELEQRDYVLKVMQRNTQANTDKRRATIAEWNKAIVKEHDDVSLT